MARVWLLKLGFWGIFAGIVIACLWPFHSPRNHVVWAAHGDGLSFGRFGTILSRDVIRPGNQPRQGSTVEIWLQPKYVWHRGTIFAFYRRHSARGFSLSQSNGSFVVKTGPWNKEDNASDQEFYAGPTFGRPGFTFLTLTFGPDGTQAYINGALVHRAPQFRVSADELSGTIIVANSPVLPDSWSGELKGLALYGREMTSSEVFQDYKDWTTTGQPQITPDQQTIALYLFRERSGSVIHNPEGSGGELFIPKRYMELHHTLLRRPWDEYSPGWGYWEDVLINIAGFVPLGFFGFAYLSSIFFTKRPALVTILLGFLLSLTVEILQAYVPTRDSGLTDVVTNTVGSAAGIALCCVARVVSERLISSRYAGARYLGAVFAGNREGTSA
jgi:hypothetical protein